MSEMSETACLSRFRGAGAMVLLGVATAACAVAGLRAQAWPPRSVWLHQRTFELRLKPGGPEAPGELFLFTMSGGVQSAFVCHPQDWPPLPSRRRVVGGFSYAFSGRTAVVEGWEGKWEEMMRQE